MTGKLEQEYTEDESRMKSMRDVWEISYLNSQAKERVGYPTQKPLAVLDRIIRASSNEGDVVLDPFCGCATTCVAADDLGRDWVGIDISPKAAELVVQRIKTRQGLFQDIVHRTDTPKRTDLGKLPRYNSAANKQWLYGLQAGYCAGCGEAFPTAQPGSRPHHLGVKGRDGPCGEPAAAVRGLQPGEGQSWDGVSKGEVAVGLGDGRCLFADYLAPYIVL